MSELPIDTAGQTPVRPAPGEPRRTLSRRLVRAGVGVLVGAMVGIYVKVAGPMMWSALRHLAGASVPWLLVGLAATMTSIVAFAALRSKTLAVAGVRIPLRRTVAVSYGAGAVHVTLPAGGVFSTTYAYRHLRRWGASLPATTWSMTVTGLLGTVTLSAVGLTGVALSGGMHGSPMWPIVEIAAVALVIVGLVRLTSHPDRLMRIAGVVLGRVNRLRRRPAETGFARLRDIMTDLGAIRPSGWDWTAAVLLAALNWLLDLACLAACCAAVDLRATLPALLITYTAGMAAASLIPVPAGLGAVETAMTVGLTVAGAAASPALAAVLLYRLISTGSVVAIGWIVVATAQKQAGATSFRNPVTGTP